MNNRLDRSFSEDARRLDNKALQQRQLTQAYKTCGLLSAGLGVLGLIGTGVAVVPLVSGLVLWGVSAANEKKNTGRFMPIPGSSTTGAGIMSGTVREDYQDISPALTSYDYLSLDDKADYTIRTVLKPVVIELLSGSDHVDAELKLTAAKRTLIKHFPHILEDPDAMASSLHGSVDGFRGAFAKCLPEDIKNQVNPTVLSAATESKTLEDYETKYQDAPNAAVVALPIGNQTRLKALDVQSVPVISNEHENISSNTSQVDKEVSTNILFSNGNINKDFLSLPIKERAKKILALLKAEGCDIEQFVGDQIMGATGSQRSGKTTLLMILSILESVMNDKELHYITVDDDVYPVAFTSMTCGLESGKAAYRNFINKLESLEKGKHKHVITILDECTKATDRLEDEYRDLLWNGLITGFIKTGASVRLAVHGTTSKTMGIPNGLAAQVKDESTFVKAQRVRDVTKDFEGTGKWPSGKYLGLDLDGINYVPTEESFQLPNWLLFDKNEDGDKCYVRSLLRFFPEKDTRISGFKCPSYLSNSSPSVETILPSFEVKTGNEDVHISADTHIAPSSNYLPGTKRSFTEIVEKISDYLAKNPNREVTPKTSIQGFASAERASIESIVPAAWTYLQTTKPSSYIIKNGSDSQPRIMYLDNPLNPPI